MNENQDVTGGSSQPNDVTSAPSADPQAGASYQPDGQQGSQPSTPQAIPYSRFAEVNAKYSQLRQQYEAFNNPESPQFKAIAEKGYDGGWNEAQSKIVEILDEMGPLGEQVKEYIRDRAAGKAQPGQFGYRAQPQAQPEQTGHMTPEQIQKMLDDRFAKESADRSIRESTRELDATLEQIARQNGLEGKTKKMFKDAVCEEIVQAANSGRRDHNVHAYADAVLVELQKAMPVIGRYRTPEKLVPPSQGNPAQTREQQEAANILAKKRELEEKYGGRFS